MDENAAKTRVERHNILLHTIFKRILLAKYSQLQIAGFSGICLYLIFR
jgi:hypothetical protein